MQPWCLDSWVMPYGSGCRLSVFTHPRSRSNTPQPVRNETSLLHDKECTCSPKLFPHQRQSYAWRAYWKSTHAASSAPPQQPRRLSPVSPRLPPSFPEQPPLSFVIQFSLPLLTPFRTSSSHRVLCVPAPAQRGDPQFGSVTGLLLLCQRETIFNQPEYSDHSYFSGEMPMHASA